MEKQKPDLTVGAVLNTLLFGGEEASLQQLKESVDKD